MKKTLSILLCSAILLWALLATALPAFGEEEAEPLRYGGSTITEPDVRYVYELLADELTKELPPQRIIITDQSKEISPEELRKAFCLFVSDYPECFWVTINYSYSHVDGNVTAVTPNYSFTDEALTEARQALDRAVLGILSGLPSTNNYEKALYIHDRLASHVTYAEVGEHQSAYGALVDGKAVCAGYTAAYQLLLQKAGIDAWSVGGVSIDPANSSSVEHAWNLVWIEDGVCVYTDVTWNDSEDVLFHYYFNMSRDEISQDHQISDDIYSLPDCTHDTESYFDVNKLSVNDSTTAEQLAAMFGATQNGERRATVYYEGNDIDGFLTWLEDNLVEICTALSCGPGVCGIRASIMANELHITVSGNFPPMTYRVNITAPSSMKTYENEGQYVEIGTAMDTVTYIAENGYYFPDDYFLPAVNGISIDRISYKAVRVSGIPQDDTEITLPEATAMEKEEAPQAVFTSTGNGTGILSSVSVGMKYSFDGKSWTQITNTNDIELSGITESEMYVIKSGNGETTLDSDIQRLNVPCPLKPEESEADTSTPDFIETENETKNTDDSFTETEEADTSDSTAEKDTASQYSGKSTEYHEDKDTEEDFKLPKIGCKLTSGISVALICTAVLSLAVLKRKKSDKSE